MAKSSSNFFSIVLALIILGVTGWQGWVHFEKLSSVKAHAEAADTTLFDLEQSRGDLESDYETARAEFMQGVSDQEAKIEGVLPSNENLTQLTRTFDEFALSVQDLADNQAFFISQITYGDMTEESSFRSLPITMTLETSERNFYKFLEYIASSGSLDPVTQLLSIESVSIQMTEDEAWRVQFALNAYFK